MIRSVISGLYGKRYYIVSLYGIGFAYVNREEIQNYVESNKVLSDIVDQQIVRKDKCIKKIKDIFEIDH